MTCKDCLHYEACDEQKKINHKLSKSVCKHFKHKSHFVELPCRVGDELYAVRKSERIGKFYIKGFDVYEVLIGATITLKTIAWSLPKCGLSQRQDTWFDLNEIDKTVFLSREEAEKALKEQVGKK